MGGDGPLILNAILVVVERYSALKRARFGSETSAAALRGMCVLLCLADGSEEDAERDGTIRSGVPQQGGPIPQGEIGIMCAIDIQECARHGGGIHRRLRIVGTLALG